MANEKYLYEILDDLADDARAVDPENPDDVREFINRIIMCTGDNYRPVDNGDDELYVEGDEFTEWTTLVSACSRMVTMMLPDNGQYQTKTYSFWQTTSSPYRTRKTIQRWHLTLAGSPRDSACNHPEQLAAYAYSFGDDLYIDIHRVNVAVSRGLVLHLR